MEIVIVILYILEKKNLDFAYLKLLKIMKMKFEF